MTHILSLIYNWSFLIGGLAGYIGFRTYCRFVENRHEPATRSHVSRIWLAGLITAATIGYVLLTAQRAEDQAVAIAKAQVNCQNDLNRVVKERSVYTNRVNELSQRRADLLDELNASAVEWLNELLNPTDQAIADLSFGDQRRQDYGVEVTRLYYTNVSKIRNEIADVRRQQDQVNQDLASHPIPPLCNAP